MPHAPGPPFTEATAQTMIKAIEDAWNARNPDVVAECQTEDSWWRHRDEFVVGREAIREFLRRQWENELHFCLKHTLWTYSHTRISVSFECEWQDAESRQWYRSYGNEHWEFADRDTRMSW